GGIRLGLRYVSGMRAEIGKAIAVAVAQGVARGFSRACPKCGCDDPTMLEQVTDRKWFCNHCSHDWTHQQCPARFKSLDDLVARTGLRRDEIVTLADIGALNAFGYDRRSALWQVERAVRPTGALFADQKTAENAEDAEKVLYNENSADSAVSSF